MLFSFLWGRGFLNQLPNRTQFKQVFATHLRTRYHTADELDYRCIARRLLSNFSHIYTASYQRLRNITYVEMIATHRYSSPKTGGIIRSHTHLRIYIRISYHSCEHHALHAYFITLLTSTATSLIYAAIRNSALCWAKRWSSRLS